MADIFVSYASNDRERVQPLVAHLEQAGYSVWWDTRIGIGSSFDREIERALDDARCVVVVWSQTSVQSDWVRAEAQEGLDRGILVPVRIDDVKLPLAFRRSQTADLSETPLGENAVRGLLQAIAKLTAAVPVEPASASSPLSLKEKRVSRLPSWIAAAAVILTIAMIVGWLRQAETIDEPVPEVFAKQKLAILPLRNLSPDKDLTWLVESLSEQLQRQIAAWDHFDVVPAAFVRDRSIDDLPADVNLVVDGFFQGTETDVEVTLNLLDMTDRSEIWSQTFSIQHSETAELQQQIATSIALFFGESMGAIPPPNGAEAYAAFLRMLPHQVMGNVDQQIYWLKRTLELDPDWGVGWSSLAYATLRAATHARDAAGITEGRRLLVEHWDDTVGEFYVINAFASGLFSNDLPSAGEEMMREIGYTPGYAWLLLTAGLYSEAAGFAERFVQVVPFEQLAWQILVLARANLGDAEGALTASRALMRLYPNRAGNAPAFIAWALPNSGQLAEAAEWVADLERSMAQMGSDSKQKTMLEQMAYYPLVFELALQQGDRGRATEAADWFAGQGMNAQAGILYLRLEDPRATEYLSRDPEPQFDRLFWSFATLHLTPQLRGHSLVVEVENKLGFTREWRLEFCKRAATFPPESYIDCDPASYESSVEVNPASSH